jgi:hypothetical protein
VTAPQLGDEIKAEIYHPLRNTETWVPRPVFFEKRMFHVKQKSLFGDTTEFHTTGEPYILVPIQVAFALLSFSG